MWEIFERQKTHQNPSGALAVIEHSTNHSLVRHLHDLLPYLLSLVLGS